MVVEAAEEGEEEEVETDSRRCPGLRLVLWVWQRDERQLVGQPWDQWVVLQRPVDPLAVDSLPVEVPPVA